MTKNDLKAGYVVETRNPDLIYMCVPYTNGLTLNRSNGSFEPLKNYRENLKHNDMPEFDIIRVYGLCDTQTDVNVISSRNRPLIWERKEDVTYATEADVIKAAIEANGNDYQLCVAMEECAELVQAISKYKRYGTGEAQEHIAEEIADVLIVIDEVKQICNITDEQIKSYHDKKIDRLKERLKVGK